MLLVMVIVIFLKYYPMYSIYILNILFLSVASKVIGLGSSLLVSFYKD